MYVARKPISLFDMGDQCVQHSLMPKRISSITFMPALGKLPPAKPVDSAAMISNQASELGLDMPF